MACLCRDITVAYVGYDVGFLWSQVLFISKYFNASQHPHLLLPLAINSFWEAHKEFLGKRARQVEALCSCCGGKRVSCCASPACLFHFSLNTLKSRYLCLYRLMLNVCKAFWCLSTCHFPRPLQPTGENSNLRLLPVVYICRKRQDRPYHPSVITVKYFSFTVTSVVLVVLQSAVNFRLLCLLISYRIWERSK